MATKSSWMVCLLIVIVLAACVQQGLSIKCWTCRSDLDPSCADPIDNTTLPITDCSQEAELPHLPGVKSKMCRKTRQIVNGRTMILRGCGYLDDRPANETRSCWVQSNSPRIYIEYCSCDDKDGCNTGTTVYSYQFFILFGALLTCFINRF